MVIGVPKVEPTTPWMPSQTRKDVALDAESEKVDTNYKVGSPTVMNGVMTSTSRVITPLPIYDAVYITETYNC